MKYTTSAPTELRMSMPSMVPVSRQSRLPSTMFAASATETSQTRSVPVIALPTTLPTAPRAMAKSIAATPTPRDVRTLAAMTRLRRGTRVNVGQAAALAPLARDRQDGNRGKDDRHRAPMALANV